MRRGQLRMALRLLPWVAARVFETFVPAQGGSEMKNLAGRLIQVLCRKGGRIYFGWPAGAAGPPAPCLAVLGGHGMWNLMS